MKVSFLIACTLALLSRYKVKSAAAVKAPLDIITLEDLTHEDRKQLEYLNEREKRSGSYDILNSLKTAIGNGIKKKIGQIAKSSASASGHFSSSSSGSTGQGYQPIETYDKKSFDFWSLKKSILNTLLQAVKAIKGGVIAIKGQLIKGSGHLISAKGKLITSKGESITNLGKNIAASALLVPHGQSAHGYAEPAHQVHYDHAHGGYHDYHGSPSAPGPEYEIPESYHNQHHDETHNGHSGILLLKKIPNDGRDFSSSHTSSVIEKVPSFKPLESSGPSFTTIFGKFFKASTSLNPQEPIAFGNSAPSHEESHVYHDEGRDIHHDHHDHLDHHSHHDHLDHHSHHNHQSSELHYSKDESSIDIKPPSSSYGSPFESEPSYLSEYSASSSKHHPVIVKHPNSIPDQSSSLSTKEPNKNTASLESIEELKAPEPTNSVLSSEQIFYAPSKLPLNLDDLPNIESFPPYPGELPPEFIAKYGKPSPTKLTPSSHKGPTIFLPTPLGNGIPATASSLYGQKIRPNQQQPFINRPTVMTLTNKPFNAEIVRSISFELGPNGPKRLT